MANPQLEDGFFRIANEIAEAMGHLILNSEESRCLWVLFRLTYGYNKKSDYIGLSQFAEDTGVARSHISRALASLKVRNIITITPGHRNQYAFQKDYTKWINRATREEVTQMGNKIKEEKVTQSGNNLLPNRVKDVTQSGNKLVTQSGTLQIQRKDITPKTTKDSLTNSHELVPQKKPKTTKQKTPPDPRVTEVFRAICEAYGETPAYAAKQCKDILAMLKRNKDPSDIYACWLAMYKERNVWIELSWVARDITDFQRRGNKLPERRNSNAKAKRDNGPDIGESAETYFKRTEDFLAGKI